MLIDLNSTEGREVPKIGDSSGGMQDRLVIIPFNARFRGAEGEIRGHEMNAMISRPGFRRALLQIAIEGLIDSLNHGYVMGEAAAAATREYLSENALDTDSVLAFLTATEGETDGGEWVAVWDGERPADVYKQYAAWALTNGRRAVSSNRFFADFKRHRPQYERKRVRTGDHLSWRYEVITAPLDEPP